MTTSYSIRLKARKKTLNWLHLALLMALLLSMLNPALTFASAEYQWQAFPKELKTKAGVRATKDTVFATGMAQAEKIRKDKAFELARKKSLLRAVQMVHIFSGCSHESLSLSEADYQIFMELFSPLVTDATIEGLQIVRQWETDDAAFTAVAVPADSAHSLSCPIESMEQAISFYIAAQSYSLEGLAFCLDNTDKYSTLYKKILVGTGRWFQARGLEELALCFLKSDARESSEPLVEDIALENRLHRADKLVNLARICIEKENWEDAVIYSQLALELIPTYAPAHLLIADYFEQTVDSPAMSIVSAKAALRSGTVYKDTLNRLVNYLAAGSDPEEEIYRYFLNQSKPVQREDYFTFSDDIPESWYSAFQCFKDDPLLNLVVVSLGNAVKSENGPPAPEYQEALGMFNQSESKENIERVIEKLMLACQKQPASAETYNLMGACFRYLGEYEVAIPFFWQALNLKPEFDMALVNLGLCCDAIGLKKSAEFYFENDAVRGSANGWVQSSYVKFNEEN